MTRVPKARSEAIVQRELREGRGQYCTIYQESKRGMAEGRVNDRQETERARSNGRSFGLSQLFFVAGEPICCRWPPMPPDPFRALPTVICSSTGLLRRDCPVILTGVGMIGATNSPGFSYSRGTELTASSHATEALAKLRAVSQKRR